MDLEQRKANEKYFIAIMRITKQYIWKDTGDIYKVINNKFKPINLKAYVNLAGITTKGFMDIFVELPDDTLGLTKDEIWKRIMEVDKPAKKTKVRANK